MKSLVRREPLGEMVSLRDAMDRLFEDSFIWPRFITPFREGFAGELALDVVENENELMVKASVPGFKPEEIEISIVGDVLTIKGETKEEKKEEKKNYLLQERRYGAVHRSVTLPCEVQADKAKAEFEHGVLTLTLPKAEEIKPKQIKITAKNNK